MSGIEPVRLGRGIRVLEDRVLIRRDKPIDRSKGGIILPDQSKDVPDEGEVVAVGPGKAYPLSLYDKSLGEEPFFRIPMTVEVGDKVVFLRYGGTTLRHEGEDLVVLRESDVVAVVEKARPVLPEVDDGGGPEAEAEAEAEPADGAPPADEPSPAVSTARIWPVRPDGTVGDVGILGQDVAFGTADDGHGFATITVGRLIAPHAVLTAFFRRYGDLTEVDGNRLRIQVDDQAPRDYERALIDTLGITARADDMMTAEHICICARECAA